MSDDTDKQTAENGSTASLPPSADDGRGDAGRFAAGNPGGPGRPKGEPNRIGADLKDDLWNAYQRRGGAAWLEALPPKTFAGLLAKLLPRELSADLRVKAEGGFGTDLDSMDDQELQRYANVLGCIARRHEGEIYFYEDADEALQLYQVQSALSGGTLPVPLVRECLKHTLEALKRRLPELAELQERLERKLAEPAEPAGQTR